MFNKLRRKKKRRQHEPETSASSSSSTKHLWLPSKVQGIVYSLRAQQKEWRTNRSLVARWSRYSPSPLRHLKKLFSTSSEPNLSDSDGAQRLSEDEWDAGAVHREDSSRDLEEIESFERLKSSTEEIGSSYHDQEGCLEEGFHWVDSDTSMKLKEPNKHYYVLTPGIAQQSDLSSGELTLQFRHDEGESDTSSTMIHKAQEPLKVNDESFFQESVDNFVGSTKIPLSLYKTKIPEEKCVPCLDGEASYTSVVNDNMPIVGSSEKNFEIQRRPFQHEGRLPETKANAACSDGVRDLSAPPQYGMVAPSIVLQQPEQLTILELSPARPSLSRLHLKADVTDGSARKSPVTVQEWVDSLPLQLQRGEEDSEEPHQQEPDEHLDLGLGAEAGLLFAVCPEVEVSSADHGSACKKAKHREGFVREASLQSDVTSHTGSSMESYLESRRADPEEVLLGLGFGGTAGGVRSEVSRIPRRFLQPSQVKGVAVDDFLHYQQDLIEKFETGFSGYRGLVGPSQTPSVIVAKIMEKLRDHERESSCRSSVASHLSTSTPASVPPPPPPPPAELKKFSHMARKVMKRTNVTRALSVLSPANREFLDSQGSKSPEVPRKRMIIGQRSFTFSGDGDLIEVESRPSSPSHEPSPKQVHGPAKQLVHKDSVLSLATSASMTSIDSDSDTDDRSSEYEMRNRISRPPPPTLPCCDVGPTLPTSTSTSLPANHRQRILDKRMSSTSLSSWEMETSAHSTERSNRLLDASGPSDGNVEGSKSQPNSNALSFLRTKCESIDEDVNMEVISNSHNSLNSSSIVEKVESTSDVELGMEASEELCVIPICPSDEAVLPPFFTSVQQHQTPTCLVRDQVCMLHRDKSLRRGSLKRQQHIVEDDDIDKTEEGIEDSASTLMPIAPFAVQNNENLLQMVPDTRGDSFEMEEILPLDEEKELFNLTRARSDSSGFLEGDVTENISSNNCPPSNTNNNNNNNNNTVNTVNTDQALGTSESCHSTTNSGHVSESVREVVAEHEDVCMQSPATRLPSQHPEVVNASCGGVHERDLGSSTMPLDVVPAEGCDVWSMLGVWGSDRYVKRLSLPVVCVHDELGNVRSWRSCTSDDGSAVTCTVRRVRSAPQSLCDADELRAATVLQACCSFGNMFSFCSDESVIHVGARKGGARPCACRRSSGSSSRRHSASFDNLSVQRCGHHGARHCFQEGKSRNLQLADSSKCAANDLQELIHELTARGLEVGKFFDTHNACHSESQQQAHLHASTLRLAVEAYKKQLSVTPEVRPGGFQECAEAQEELEVTRGICGRITGELRHIADLLEEEPTVRMANVTCQMTELLREQTRLYEQLTSCGSGTSSVLPPDVVSLHTSLVPQADVSRSDRCCCSKQIISVVREEHGRLEQLIKKNTDELAEIRHLLCELLSKNSNV